MASSKCLQNPCGRSFELPPWPSQVRPNHYGAELTLRVGDADWRDRLAPIDAHSDTAAMNPDPRRVLRRDLLCFLVALTAGFAVLVVLVELVEAL